MQRIDRQALQPAPAAVRMAEAETHATHPQRRAQHRARLELAAHFLDVVRVDELEDVAAARVGRRRAGDFDSAASLTNIMRPEASSKVMASRLPSVSAMTCDQRRPAWAMAPARRDVLLGHQQAGDAVAVLSGCNVAAWKPRPSGPRGRKGRQLDAFAARMRAGTRRRGRRLSGAAPASPGGGHWAASSPMRRAKRSLIHWTRRSGSRIATSPGHCASASVASGQGRGRQLVDAARFLQARVHRSAWFSGAAITGPSLAARTALVAPPRAFTARRADTSNSRKALRPRPGK